LAEPDFELKRRGKKGSLSPFASTAP